MIDGVLERIYLSGGVTSHSTVGALGHTRGGVDGRAESGSVVVRHFVDVDVDVDVDEFDGISEVMKSNS